MRATTWHIEDEALKRYLAVAGDGAEAYSIEAHLEQCDACRGRCALFAPTSDRAATVWADILDTIDLPRQSIPERALGAVGVPAHWTRVLSATRALRTSSLLLEIALASSAVVVARLADQPQGLSLFLLVASLAPLLCTALVFRPSHDPAGELFTATSLAGMPLVLRRCALVLSITIVVFGISSIFVGASWRGAAWLVPSLALVITALALSTVVGAKRAVAVVAFGWTVIVVSGPILRIWGHGSEHVVLRMFGESAQLVAAGATMCAAIVLYVRRGHLEPAMMLRKEIR